MHLQRWRLSGRFRCVAGLAAPMAWSRRWRGLGTLTSFQNCTSKCLLFLKFPNLKSSDPTVSDSGGIRWRQFSGLRTGPLGRREALRIPFLYSAQHLQTLPGCRSIKDLVVLLKKDACLDFYSPKSELMCSHVVFAAGLCSGVGKWRETTPLSCLSAHLIHLHVGELAKKAWLKTSVVSSIHRFEDNMIKSEVKPSHKAIII